MIWRYNSTLEDDRVALDENADVLERSTAISHLALDDRFDFEPLLAKLLSHPSQHLRAEAVKTLVGTWMMNNYLNPAMQMLHNDTEWLVRSTAAYSLTMYALQHDTERERILHELVRALLQDNDPSVQKRCYSELLRLLEPERMSSNTPRYFDRDRDVDWDLLRPYISDLQS